MKDYIKSDLKICVQIPVWQSMSQIFKLTIYILDLNAPGSTVQKQDESIPAYP